MIIETQVFYYVNIYNNIKTDTEGSQGAAKQGRSPHQAKEHCRSHCVLAALYSSICSLWSLLNESMCIIFKGNILLNLELNKIHACILLWNRFATMTMYCANRPTNRK